MLGSSMLQPQAAIEYDLSGLKEVTNSVYWDLYRLKDRYMVLYGGAGSGKSHFIAQKYLVRIMVGESRTPCVRHKILALRKTQPAARKSVFALFLYYIDLWGLNQRVKINHTDMVIRFKRSETQIICSGLDDPTKVKSIEGVTSIWMEEATEFTHPDFLQLDLRLRGKFPTYLQICISFNPVECKWLKKEFFNVAESKLLSDVSKSNKTRYRRIKKSVEVPTSRNTTRKIETFATVLLTTWKDNVWLDDAQIANIVSLRDKDLTWYEIYGLGQWGSPSGQVYKENLNWYLTDKWPARKDFRWHGLGLDWGYTNHPTGILEMGILPNARDVYIRELVYETGLTNQDICEKLTQLKVSKYDIICADNAEPKSIEEVQRGGFHCVACEKGRDSINHGIATVKDYKVHVYSGSLNLIKEKRNYKWKDNKEGEPLNIPVDEWNHLLDPERYILTKLMGYSKTAVILNLGNRYPRN